MNKRVLYTYILLFVLLGIISFIYFEKIIVEEICRNKFNDWKQRECYVCIPINITTGYYDPEKGAYIKPNASIDITRINISR